jgi:hypothetical protein
MSVKKKTQKNKSKTAANTKKNAKAIPVSEYADFKKLKESTEDNDNNITLYKQIKKILTVHDLFSKSPEIQWNEYMQDVQEAKFRRDKNL